MLFMRMYKGLHSLHSRKQIAAEAHLLLSTLYFCKEDISSQLKEWVGIKSDLFIFHFYCAEFKYPL